VFRLILYRNSTVLAPNNHLGTNFKVSAVQELLHGSRLVMPWVMLLGNLSYFLQIAHIMFNNVGGY